jgi:hypothetical protein
MATTQINLSGGGKHVVKHQFGTVRRLLNDAATRKANEKTGDVAAFAEFRTDQGQRILVNPESVVDAVMLSGDDGDGSGE